MNTNMLFMLLALGGSGSGSSGNELLQTLMLSGDMLPAMPRTLLALNAVNARDRDQAALAGEVHATLKEVIGTGARIPKSVIDGRPTLKALLDRLTAAQRDEIIDPG